MSRHKALRITAVAAVLVVGLLVAATASAAKGKSKIRRVTAAEQLSFGVDMAKRGLWREALFRFQRARQLDPGMTRVLNNLAVAYEAVGDFDRALEHYKLALAADPGNRDLKKNYARFVEFYQSFRPAGEAGDEAAEGEEEDPETPTAAGG